MLPLETLSFFFFLTAAAPSVIYTLSLHDALPISAYAAWLASHGGAAASDTCGGAVSWSDNRSEEHTSELQSLTNLVCRLLLEKKKRKKNKTIFCLTKCCLTTKSN